MTRVQHVTRTLSAAFAALAIHCGQAGAEDLSLGTGSLRLLAVERASAPHITASEPWETAGAVLVIEGAGNTVLAPPVDGNRIRVAVRGEANGAGPNGRGAFEALLPGGLVPGTLRQEGRANDIALAVSGEANLFAISQTGSGNLAVGTVAGARNQAAIAQDGVGNALHFSQHGNGNMLGVRQVSW